MKQCKYFERPNWTKCSCHSLDTYTDKIQLKGFTAPKACPLREICKYREDIR